MDSARAIYRQCMPETYTDSACKGQALPARGGWLAAKSGHSNTWGWWSAAKDRAVQRPYMEGGVGVHAKAVHFETLKPNTWGSVAQVYARMP